MLETTDHDFPQNKNDCPIYDKGNFKTVYLKILDETSEKLYDNEHGKNTWLREN